MGKRTHVAVVHDLLGLQIISEKATREPVQPLVIASHQCGKGGRVSRPHIYEHSASARPSCVLSEVITPILVSAAVNPLDAPVRQNVPALRHFFNWPPTAPSNRRDRHWLAMRRSKDSGTPISKTWYVAFLTVTFKREEALSYSHRQATAEAARVRTGIVLG
jgi:hypothetical protein